MAANPSWTLATRFKQSNFGFLASTYGYPFIEQVQPLSVVSFGNFSYHTFLSYPLGI